MNTLLGTEYSSPIDIDLNQITKNWAGFLKLHLNNVLKDGLTLLRGELEKEDWIIGKVEKWF